MESIVPSGMEHQSFTVNADAFTVVSASQLAQKSIH